MYLPEKFSNKMKQLLGNEFEAFLKSYEDEKFQGLRVNTLKISIEDFKKISPFKLRPIPWCKDGFYFEEGERPAKHPYYHAGLYYIQEPSAMAPVEILNPTPKDKVLDLCAAPGGKSVQISAKLRGQGLLITNDINMNRVKALIKNMELFGIKNAIVTNETPEKMKNYFKDYFHKILVDAPCSGEGMFRKDASMVKSWEKHDETYYAPIQQQILENIEGMLKKGGRLFYSTCTFSPEENEATIKNFIENHENFHIVEIPKNNGLSKGRHEWVHGEKDLEGCARLWPHKLEGEGHFLALLEKDSEGENISFDDEKKSKIKPSKEFYEFMKENLNIEIEGKFEVYSNNLYLVPKGLPELKGLKVLRSGWFLGTFKKNRFEPSHALAMGLTFKDAKRIMNFHREDMEVKKYLKGETLNIGGEKGWTLVCVDHFPLGWAKQTGNMLKNCYPSAWRWID
ncbi:RsmF rRNA methyltransferase first C-terminal domain-containing protein [Crassaminicella profunda]|uniref:RsmF rRNA methyltransferase first C-terminal domain-containing protein n=1 Tax=Crassaminicella profunda TaxID=1286698 RepID=UPI001CA760BE|nr:RsmB/NOP family class I SAM-dependent RNA methyltransferase [Crassaminicella profunda]QZY53656.1 RsmB/NOP family class I SAM-dependent RNA methyltransferase [Crassaminicella profunda]